MTEVHSADAKFYHANVFDEEFDFTVLEGESAPLDEAPAVASRVVEQIFSGRVLRGGGAAVMFVAALTAGPIVLPTAMNDPTWVVGARPPVERSAPSIPALTGRMRQRAALVAGAFRRVPLSAAERRDDPDYGF